MTARSRTNRMVLFPFQGLATLAVSRLGNRTDASQPDPLANIRIAPSTAPWPIGADLSRVGPVTQTRHGER